jgi:hypothetical protein
LLGHNLKSIFNQREITYPHSQFIDKRQHLLNPDEANAPTGFEVMPLSGKVAGY